MRTSILLIVLLVLVVSAASGCSQDQGQPVSSVATPAKTQKRNATATETASRSISQAPKDHAPPTSSEFAKTPDNPLVRGLSEMLKTSKLDELDKDGQLRRNLQQADSVLTRIKKENLEALRQANRQVRRPGTRSPVEHGYDDWLGFLDENEASNQFPEFLWRKNERLRFIENAGGKKTHYANDLFTKVATTFLKQHPQNRPFFLHLAFTIAHPNLIVPSDAPYAEKDWSQPQKNYAAMIFRLDRRIGDIQARLEQLGIDKNTIIIFTSENAPHTLQKGIAAFFSQNVSLNHTGNTRPSSRLRVPFIVHGPGHISPGNVTHHASSFCDLAPMLADIVEANHRPVSSDGVSLVHVF